MSQYNRNAGFRNFLEQKARRYFLYALSEILLIAIGIMLALQLNNWNEGRKQLNLQSSYLDRLAEELQADTSYFGSQARLNREAKASVEVFARALNDPSVSDEELIRATRQYLALGWIIPKYAPIVTTFEDLSATGNLGVIRDPELRELIVHIYGEFERSGSITEGNREWANSIDTRFTYEFDALRWDPRTSHLFPSKGPHWEAAAVRRDAAAYLLNASVHYWVIDRVLGLYETSIGQAVQTIEAIRTKQAETRR